MSRVKTSFTKTVSEEGTTAMSTTGLGAGVGVAVGVGVLVGVEVGVLVGVLVGVGVMVGVSVGVGVGVLVGVGVAVGAWMTTVPSLLSRKTDAPAEQASVRAVNANVVPVVLALALSEIEHSRKVLLGGVPVSMPRLWVRVPAELSKVL